MRSRRQRSAVEETTGTISVRAAFCHKGEMWTDVGGHMPTVEKPTDKAFQTLITQVTIGLFPDPGSHRD
ncbi:hypothetical protein [Roseovarius pacificus]|uniref:hypothetical protein n=1 Tax=Roseovarius pacificus TaxID=337701 RepID=UPI002A189895|nr:hypothetical protein [Roseovarius pacificus]